MSETSELGGQQLIELVERISKDFRKSWKAGDQPRLDDYLNQVPHAAREVLFRYLLPLEIRYRERAGETPRPSDYLTRYPDFRRVIGDEFHQSTSASIALDSPPADNQDDVTATVDHDHDTKGRIGDYELLKLLGRGGFGMVYEARHRQRGHRVALKMLLGAHDGRGFSAERLHRFRREFRTLSEINHRHLVGMQSLEVDGDRWFFTMDLIDGVDFLSYVRSDGQLDEARLRLALKQLAEGIFALHERGIVHRDLKPNNVLVSKDGHVTILDFGLVAQLPQGDATVSRSIGFAGTPPYAAPEQSFGERTEASDWYALGTMLFEALAGKRPFQDADPMQLLHRKQNENPPQLTSRIDFPHAEFPDDLATLTDGLLKRRPQERLTPSEIAERLDLHLETRSHGSTDSASSLGEELEDVPLTMPAEVELVGRDEQLKQLKQAHEQWLAQQHPVVVWVSGLSGEGKSALVEHFLGPLRNSTDTLVLSGRCYNRESIPLKALDSQIEPLVRHLRDLSNAELERLLPRDIERLAQLFPLLRRVESIDARCHQSLRSLSDREVHTLGVAALHDLITSLSHDRPIMMFIDDVQWGDSDSASILADLLRRPQPPRLMLIGSFRRDEQGESPFLKTWEQRSPSRDLVHSFEVQVKPLTEPECLTYVRSRLGEESLVSEAQLRELYNNTKGNPYFVEQLVAGYDTNTGHFNSVPLKEIIRRRVAACPSDSRELLNLIAIAGKSLRVSELVELVETSPDATSTLGHMQSEHLIRRVGSGDGQRVDTYHDKIREEVLAQLDQRALRALHLQMAEYLEREVGPSATETPTPAAADRLFDLAFHFTEAGDPRAFKYQLAAGERAQAAYANEAAVNHFQEAKARVPSDVNAATNYRLHFGLAAALFARDQLGSAIDESKTALSQASHRLQRAECHYLTGVAEWKRSEYSSAKEQFREAWLSLGERWPKSTLWRLSLAFSNLFAFMCVPRQLYFRVRKLSPDEAGFLARSYAATKWHAGQLDIADFLLYVFRSGVTVTYSTVSEARADTYATIGHLFAFCGFPNWMGRRLIRMAVGESARVGQTESESGRFEGNLLAYSFTLGDHEQADRYSAVARAKMSRTGDHMLSSVDHWLWHSWSIRGNATRLQHHARNEIEVAKRSNDVIIDAWGKYGLAEGLAKSGQVAEGLAMARESLRTLEERNAWTVSVARVQLARTLLQAEGKDYAEAADVTMRAIRECPRLRLNELTAAAFPLHVEASLGPQWVRGSSAPFKTRVRTRTLAFLGRLLARSFPNLKPHAFRVSGRLAASCGRVRRAEKFFHQAMDAAKKIGGQYELARTLLDLSMLERPDAEEYRVEGLELLESLGCVVPDAEVECSGVNRDAHHARAKVAREAEAAKIHQELNAV